MRAGHEHKIAARFSSDDDAAHHLPVHTEPPEMGKAKQTSNKYRDPRQRGWKHESQLFEVPSTAELLLDKFGFPRKHWTKANTDVTTVLALSTRFEQLEAASPAPTCDPTRNCLTFPNKATKDNLVVFNEGRTAVAALYNRHAMPGKLTILLGWPSDRPWPLNLPKVGLATISDGLIM